MLELEAAQQQILSRISPLPAETVPLTSAAGRILAEAIIASVDLPPFDNSAMDGYAVRADDVKAALADAPVTLRVLGQVAAGEFFSGEVIAGSCVRIFTGSPLPAGANAVVMQEDTRPAPDDAQSVYILDAAKPWENIRLQGEDVKRGTPIAQPGEPLTAGRLGLLAATGNALVQVTRRPVIGLLATGSELREAGQPLARGQIYESNRLTLSALLAQAGAQPQIYPLAADTLADTRAALEKAFAECDAVVTTGGVSVGELDFVKAAFAALGGETDFWRVAVKPGKPFLFGRCGEKFLFGLPGNPVSAFVTFLLLVRPAVLRLQGAGEWRLPAHPGTLAQPLVNRGDRRHFLRVRVDGRGEVHSAGGQASHLLGSLAAANGLVDVPPRTTLAAGATVRVLRWD